MMKMKIVVYILMLILIIFIIYRLLSPPSLKSALFMTSDPRLQALPFFRADNDFDLKKLDEQEKLFDEELKEIEMTQTALEKCLINKLKLDEGIKTVRKIIRTKATEKQDAARVPNENCQKINTSLIQKYKTAFTRLNKKVPTDEEVKRLLQIIE